MTLAQHQAKQTPVAEGRIRVSRTGTVATRYRAGQAIYLFSAEGEISWLGDVGWDPAILSGDGFGIGDVFALHDNTFITLDFNARAGKTRLARIQEGLSAGIVDIEVRDDKSGSVAIVTYTMTSLSEAGDAKLNAMTEDAFADEMRRWQTAIEENSDKIAEWFKSRP